MMHGQPSIKICVCLFVSYEYNGMKNINIKFKVPPLPPVQHTAHLLRKSCLCFKIRDHATNAYAGVEVQFHAFFNLGTSWSYKSFDAEKNILPLTGIEPKPVHYTDAMK